MGYFREDSLEADFAPDLGEDMAARREAMALSEGWSLEKDGQAREHGRHQKFRDHVNLAALIVFWTLICCVVVALLAFVFHLLAPAHWHFIDGHRLEKLQTLLAAAILSSALTQYANKRIF